MKRLHEDVLLLGFGASALAMFALPTLADRQGRPAQGIAIDGTSRVETASSSPDSPNALRDWR